MCRHVGAPQVALEREHLLEGVSLFRFDRLTLHAIPIVVFGFNCHSTVVSVYSELEVGGQGGMCVSCRSVRRVGGVLCVRTGIWVGCSKAVVPHPPGAGGECTELLAARPCAY